MKKICVVTSTRAEYGYLKSLIFKLKEDSDVELQLIVTGTHLEEKYGYTVNEILSDGVVPTSCIKIIHDDTKLGILGTMANATTKIGEELAKLNPDILILLGDRYEIFAIASAAVILSIPVAHISGGDVTSGAYDDMFRHSITKMSNLHFTSCEEYQNRVIQLGEHPDTVFNVGSLSVENVKKMRLLPKEEINSTLEIDIGNTLLTTFHPVTMEKDSAYQFKDVLDALVEQNKYVVLFTRANADTDSSALNQFLDDYCEQYPKKLKVVDSLGQLRYFSMMKHCAGVVGNSSSGILEAPSFKVGTINIGNRQKGRIQAASIINCDAKKNDILNSIEKLSDPEFQKSLEHVINMYEGENTSQKIVQNIEIFLSNPKPTKVFFDIYKCE